MDDNKILAEKPQSKSEKEYILGPFCMSSIERLPRSRFFNPLYLTRHNTDWEKWIMVERPVVADYKPTIRTERSELNKSGNGTEKSWLIVDES